MDSLMFNFLRKLLATLYLHGVKDIPFSGEEYNKGVSAIEAATQKILPEDKYYEISDLFLKTPVQEEYYFFKDKLIALNGDQIGFSSMKNPYWTSFSISMTDYYAKNILNERNAHLDISYENYKYIAQEFCEASGVVIWEKF